MGQLCDDGCPITINKNILIVSKNNKKIIIGIRSKSGDNLWDIKLQIDTTKYHHTPIQQSANIILRIDKKSTDLASYFHASCFSPTKHTFLQAIKNNFFKSWPGLTYQLITKHLHPNIYTALGHVRLEHQGLRSTKTHSHIMPYKNIANEMICTL